MKIRKVIASGIRLHELEERLDAIDNKLLPESLRQLVMEEVREVLGPKIEAGVNPYASGMKRSGRIELDHETEGTM